MKRSFPRSPSITIIISASHAFPSALRPLSRSACLTTLLFSFLLIAFSSCQPPIQHTATEVEAAMREYDRLIQKVDGDSIALLFTPDGDLGTMAHGRDSIRHFLATFKNVKVLSATTHTDSIGLSNDTALQIGTYSQTAILNDKDTVHVKGFFRAEWIWLNKEGWRLKQMATQPNN